MSNWTDDLALSKKTQPYQDKIYRSVFGTDIVINRTDRKDNKILDVKYHIDVVLTMPNRGQLTFQEKALRHQFASFNTFTVEYHQNRNTKERGELFHICSQYYLHGYLNKDETDIMKWVIVDIPKFIIWINGFDENKIMQYVRPTSGSNANFYAYRYEYLPPQCIYKQFDAIKKCRYLTPEEEEAKRIQDEKEEDAMWEKILARDAIKAELDKAEAARKSSEEVEEIEDDEVLFA